VTPSNPNDVAGFWQQDRWSDGGAHGLVAAVSHDGGASFAYSWPHFSRCAGGAPSNGGDYGRSSIRGYRGLPTATCGRSACRRTELPRATRCWRRGCGTAPRAGANPSSSRPTPRGPACHSGTTSTTRSHSPPTRPTRRATSSARSGIASSRPTRTPRRARSRTLPASTGRFWFARTTTGAAATASWELAREINDPGTLNQTISNQIVSCRTAHSWTASSSSRPARTTGPGEARRSTSSARPTKA
jgi:hypothetical protein